ncbi:MAG: hypothetical protein OXD29_13360 [Roseovarius sp.]|nr:hypothetical protein [Roseovarius sp.]
MRRCSRRRGGRRREHFTCENPDGAFKWLMAGAEPMALAGNRAFNGGGEPGMDSGALVSAPFPAGCS